MNSLNIIGVILAATFIEFLSQSLKQKSFILTAVCIIIIIFGFFLAITDHTY